jgi:hypothetical protein
VDARLRRRIGGTGLAFIALFLISGSIVPSPDAHWSAARSVKYATDHKTSLLIACYVTVAAVAVGLALYWYLRDLLATDPASTRLASIGFAGVILFATSGGLSAGVDFAMSDVAKHASPDTIQTLNIFNADVGSLMSAGGVAAFLLTTGIVVIRTAVLGRWLGWVAAVLGVADIALPFMSGAFAAFWTLLASIALLASSRGAAVGSGDRMDPLPVT